MTHLNPSQWAGDMAQWKNAHLPLGKALGSINNMVKVNESEK